MLLAAAGGCDTEWAEECNDGGALATARVRPLPKAATSSLALPQQCSESRSLPVAHSWCKCGGRQTAPASIQLEYGQADELCKQRRPQARPKAVHLSQALGSGQGPATVALSSPVSHLEGCESVAAPVYVVAQCLQHSTNLKNTERSCGAYVT